jgi:hypothetical protein
METAVGSIISPLIHHPLISGHVAIASVVVHSLREWIRLAAQASDNASTSGVVEMCDAILADPWNCGNPGAVLRIR